MKPAAQKTILYHFSELKKPLLDYRATGISFRRVANTYLISLNGRLALKLSHDSPKRQTPLLQ
jgi:hypothetical protein